MIKLMELVLFYEILRKHSLIKKFSALRKGKSAHLSTLTHYHLSAIVRPLTIRWLRLKTPRKYIHFRLLRLTAAKQALDFRSLRPPA